MDQALQKRGWNLPLLWLHAASAGEILQAEPIIRQFEKENVQLVLSYTSVNAKVGWKMGLPSYQILYLEDYLPIDNHFIAQDFSETSATGTCLCQLRSLA